MKGQNCKTNLTKICLISSVPGTLWRFYDGLIRQLKKDSVKVTVVSSDTPRLYEMKNQFGCVILPVEITRKISPMKDLIAILKLTWHLRHEKYQIVHAHTPKGGFIGTISAFLAGITSRIYTVHGLVLETSDGWKRKLLCFVEWLTCKSATNVLVVSPSLKQRVLEEKLCPLSKMQILGDGTACGIDPEKFCRSHETAALGTQTRQGFNIPADAIVIGYVGRIVPDKGIECLVNAFEIVQKKRVNTYLLLVGAFETVRKTFDSKTMEIIRSNNYIKSAGYVENPVPFYAAMDMVVLPSLREGFGLTLIEAAALELPTVATRVTGCVDAVVDKVTGLLVNVDDDRQLAEAMLELVERPELRQKLGQEGCRRARELFDSKRLVAEHMALYERILDKKIGREVV